MSKKYKRACPKGTRHTCLKRTIVEKRKNGEVRTSMEICGCSPEYAIDRFFRE